MKNPVASQIRKNTPSIKLRPKPGFLKGSGKPPPEPGGGAPGPRLPPNNCPSFRFKSRHNSSRSGGPLLPLGGLRFPSGGGLLPGSEPLEMFWGCPSLRPQRPSFKLNAPNNLRHSAMKTKRIHWANHCMWVTQFVKGQAEVLRFI